MGFVKDANEVFKIDQVVEVEVAEIEDKGKLRLKLVKKV